MLRFGLLFAFSFNIFFSFTACGVGMFTSIVYTKKKSIC